MAILRLEPIAMELGKHTSPALLFPREALERSTRQLPHGGDEAWPPAMRDFMAHYTEVARVGHGLLETAAFQQLAALSDELEEEYGSGGPPMSPVYDSYSVQHILAEVPQGLARETPYSVLARLSSGDDARARLCEMAYALADSHLDLYRVLEAESARAQLLPLRGGEPLTVQLSGPFLRAGDVLLARVLAFGDGHFIADSPYRLAASEREWLDYVQRVRARSEAARAAGAQRARPGEARLTQKQLARRRKQQKQDATQRSPDADVVAHLKYGEGPRFWLEFIMDGYAGERNGIVLLAGVPDRPESLPHHPGYAAAGDAPPPTARARAANDAEATPPLDLGALPLEVVQQLHGMLLDQIKRRFDVPIPAFQGKTLRQVARSRSSAEAVSWLQEQERILKRNPQLQALDLRPLWQELGLEYQALQTDLPPGVNDPH